MEPDRRRLLMTADAVGGVWQYAAELAAGLPRLGFEVVIALLGPGPGHEQRRRIVSLPGVRLIETGLALDWLSDAGAVRRASHELARLARSVGADLVHLNSPTLAAGRPFDVPVVSVAHGCVATWWEAAKAEPLDAAYHWHRDLMSRGLLASDLVIAPSASFAAAVQARYRLPSRPAIVHNGRTLAPAVGTRPAASVAFTAGRLWDAVKNAAMLDAVAERLGAPFVAAGAVEGPHGERVELAHLELLGVLDEAAMARRFAERPVFVSAATLEPFGLAVLEAAHAGCPLVLSDIPTFRELWGGAALFAPARDAAGFVAAIERCLAEPALRRRLSNAARRRAAGYTGERMAAAMAGHYGSLRARRAAA